MSSYFPSAVQADDCIPRAAGSVPPGNVTCDEVTFSLSVEYYEEVFGELHIDTER